MIARAPAEVATSTTAGVVWTATCLRCAHRTAEHALLSDARLQLDAHACLAAPTGAAAPVEGMKHPTAHCGGCGRFAARGDLVEVLDFSRRSGMSVSCGACRGER